MKLQFGSVFTRNYLCALALVALSMAAARSASAQEPATSDVTTTGGAVHSLPLFHNRHQHPVFSHLATGRRRKRQSGYWYHFPGEPASHQRGGHRRKWIPVCPRNHQYRQHQRQRLVAPSGRPGTNTPNGGFSLGDDDAYWFVITFNGNVGLGLNVTNPTNALQLADGAYENGGVWTNASDRNLKENFIPINNTDLLNGAGIVVSRRLAQAYRRLTQRLILLRQRAPARALPQESSGGGVGWCNRARRRPTLSRSGRR